MLGCNLCRCVQPSAEGVEKTAIDSLERRASVVAATVKASVRGQWTEPFGAVPLATPLELEKVVTIGRMTSNEPRRLCHPFHDTKAVKDGKTSSDPNGRPVMMWATVSGKHVSLKLVNDTTVELTDHSTHGTLIDGGSLVREKQTVELDAENSPFRLRLGRDSSREYTLVIERPPDSAPTTQGWCSATQSCTQPCSP